MKRSSKLDPHYSPLLQEWSDEEDAGEINEKVKRYLDEEKGGVKIPCHPKIRKNTLKPLYIFLSLICILLICLLLSVILIVVKYNAKSLWLSSTGHAPEVISPSTSTAHVGNSVEEGPQTVVMQTSSLHSGTGVQDKISIHDWKVVFNSTGTESSVRTPDIDGDGLPDVLIGLAHGVDINLADALDEAKSLKDYCKTRHQKYPCVGMLVALRGYDGKELWRIPTRSEVIFIMCDLDLNRDGGNDCVISGRHSTTQAVDLRKGTTLWYADGSEYPSYLNQFWNVYQAVPLFDLDLDGDGVEEILIAHGGNPQLPSGADGRVSGRLILLSGATGRPLGNYLEMPNNKETYMSPVMYTDTDGSQYLLFGSGGETVSGDLLAMTLPDLLKATYPKFKVDLPGSYRWKNIIKPVANIMTLYKGAVKGVMVPPVVVDVDMDGVKDLVVSVYEGWLLLLDGKTLTIRWKTAFPGTESYSSPAPGYYDDDEYLDFMVHWSEGEWPDYNSSKVVIVSGKDGSILWEQVRPLFIMSSDLVLRTKEDHKDLFMVKMRGQRSGVGKVTMSAVHGVGAQRNITRRNALAEIDKKCEEFRLDYEKKHITCNQDLLPFDEEVYLFNRDNEGNITSILKTKAEKFTYETKPVFRNISCVPVNKQTGFVDMCVTLMPISRSTDAVTDVDNDGVLDLINVGILEGSRRDSVYDYTEMQYTTILSRLDMTTALQQLSDDTGLIDRRTAFSPLKSQPWLQYMGSKGSSVYEEH